MKPCRPRPASSGGDDDRRLRAFDDRRPPRGSSSPSILVGDRAGNNNNNRAGSVSQVYDAVLWPKIDAFLDQMLRGGTAATESILTFERKYSLVYACVANDHWERLTQDLMAKIGRFLNGLNARLRLESDPGSYALAFRAAATELIRVLGEIEDVFMHLDIVCLRPKIARTLGQELRVLIKTLFFDVHGLDLLPALPRIANRSVHFYQESCAILNLFGQFSPELAQNFPSLLPSFSNDPE